MRGSSSSSPLYTCTTPSRRSPTTAGGATAGRGRGAPALARAARIGGRMTGGKATAAAAEVAAMAAKTAGTEVTMRRAPRSAGAWAVRTARAATGAAARVTRSRKAGARPSPRAGATPRTTRSTGAGSDRPPPPTTGPSTMQSGTTLRLRPTSAAAAARSASSSGAGRSGAPRPRRRSPARGPGAAALAAGTGEARPRTRGRPGSALRGHRQCWCRQTAGCGASPGAPSRARLPGPGATRTCRRRRRRCPAFPRRVAATSAASAVRRPGRGTAPEAFGWRAPRKACVGS
mmetsp:Transcript_22936/g.66333  ORF Transcript_22936/g.66333 Transcript_22936/m.66333 type:complete len:289 (-) Transcript_22936:587-1453(-)